MHGPSTVRESLPVLTVREDFERCVPGVPYGHGTSSPVSREQRYRLRCQRDRVTDWILQSRTIMPHTRVRLGWSRGVLVRHIHNLPRRKAPTPCSWLSRPPLARSRLGDSSGTVGVGCSNLG